MMVLLFLCFHPEIEANPYAMGGHLWYADSVRSTGAKWLRMWAGDGGALWGEIQPTSLDSFYWDQQDRWIRWADSCGFNIMLTIRTGGPPGSGSIHPCKWVDSTHIPEVDSLGWNWSKASYPPQNYDDWYNFVYAVVSRYDGNTPDPARPGKFLPEVRYYETQAEPDGGYWYGTKETYFDLFVPTFVRAVRDANPNAVIVGPSLTGYGIAWAVIKEMVDSGVDTLLITEFFNSHLRYQALWPVGWNYIRNQLNNSYSVRWRIDFVNYSFADSSLYDKRGFHDYENWETSPILIDYERRWMVKHGYSRPSWWTELGHFDKRDYSAVPESEAAARTWKKMINAFSSGVEWMCYAPMYNFDSVPPIIGTSFYIPLYDDEDDFGPDTIKPLESKHSFAFIASKINEQTGFRFTSSDTISRSYLFWFSSDSLPNYTLMSAWADSGITDTVKVPVPPGTQSATLYDYLGNPSALSFSDSAQLFLTWQPVMVEFYHTAGVSEGKAKRPLGVILAPNPGRDGIALALELPVASEVTLRLYDPTGRLVLLLETGQLGPGEHRVFIPAKRGVYFLEAESGGSRRMTKAVVE